MRLTREFSFLVVALAVALAVAAMAAGFVLDAKGFAGNALSELVGAIFSVLLAVFVVDRLVDRERRRRWELVAEETIRTLRFAFTRVGLTLYLQLPAPRPPGTDPYIAAIAGVPQLARALEDLGVYLNDIDDAALGDPAEWLPEVEEQVRLARDGVMPRILTLGDADLAAALSTVEGKLQDLLHAVWLDKRFGTESRAEAAGALCVEMALAVAITIGSEA
jgi:hypothetical protein